MSYTYTVLEIPKPMWDEIHRRLTEAGYDHAFHHNSDGKDLIDMHGIALGCEETAAPERIIRRRRDMSDEEWHSDDWIDITTNGDWDGTDSGRLYMRLYGDLVGA